jgi:transcriptional regulator with XRE-family HTH domain
MSNVRTKAASPVDLEVGRRIKLERLKAGITQGALGKHIGVTFQQVQKYENGSNRVAPGRLSQIAKLLNIPVASFFECSERDSPVSAAAILTRPYVLKLVDSFDQVPPNIQRAILDLVQDLANTGGKDTPTTNAARHQPR